MIFAIISNESERRKIKKKKTKFDQNEYNTVPIRRPINQNQWNSAMLCANSSHVLVHSSACARVHPTFGRLSWVELVGAGPMEMILAITDLRANWIEWLAITDRFWHRNKVIIDDHKPINVCNIHVRINANPIWNICDFFFLVFLFFSIHSYSMQLFFDFFFFG